MKISKKHISHVEDTARARRLVNLLISKLEENLESGEVDEQWWGKDSGVSVLTKLVQLLLKLIPLEMEISGSSTEAKGITKQDMEILERYVQKRIEKEALTQVHKSESI